jgi:hexokinase
MINAAPVACEEFFSSLEKIFSISANDIRVMIEDFHAEMGKGLFGDESSLKMIPSFIDKPKGNERGEFLALDLGGTNFRVLTVKLDGKGNTTVPAASKFAIPQKDMQGTGVALFDFIAGCIDTFMTENNIDRKKTYDLAFTFSFPVEQTSIAAGKLIVWTKGFTATGVQGQDVIMLLNEALSRKDISCIRITVLANDTVGTLAAGSYTDPACDLGVIMGTGTNACYREALSNIEKLNMVDRNGHMIVNMEWGNFDKVRPNVYDRSLDKASVNPGAMYLEKMVSGMYLGEITRLVLMDLIGRKLILVNEPHVAQYFQERGSLKTEDMSWIEGDKTDRLEGVALFFERNGISNITLSDKIELKRLCRIVSSRAARLGAVAISAVLAWIDPKLKDMHTVGIDGSLFEKYLGFSTKMTDVFKELYGKKAEKIALVHSKDGSGRGAAIIAAVAASSEKNMKTK